jgi:two-component system, OmpR family, response regulator RegX3
MARVLIVERRESARASALLEAEGFTVVVAVHPRETVTVVATFRPDLVLVESVAPSTAVLELCARVRAAATAIPMLLLTGPCAERDAVAAFGSGVDSVVIEPVGRHELVARVRALVRRAAPLEELLSDVVTVGPIVLDCGRRELFVFEEQIRIPRREFDIAELLMRNVGKVVPRQKIVRELWGTVRDTKSLDVQVGRLRARLAAVEGRRRIVTVRGVGFRFLDDDDPELESVDAAVGTEMPEIEIDIRAETVEAEPVVDRSLPEVLEGSASP